MQLENLTHSELSGRRHAGSCILQSIWRYAPTRYRNRICENTTRSSTRTGKMTKNKKLPKPKLEGPIIDKHSVVC